MATVNPSVDIDIAKGARRTSWTITGTDDGFPLSAPQYPTKSVIVQGTFGGGTILIEGSSDGGVTYHTLHDPQGNDLSFTAARAEEIEEVVQLIRPRASVGVTSCVIIIVSQSGRN